MRNFKQKKQRGLKNRWRLVMKDLNVKAEESDEAIEIFTKYGFYGMSWKYKRRLLNEYNRILKEKEALNDGRYYVLWAEPHTITETSILIFDDIEDLHLLFRKKNIKYFDNPNYDVFLEPDYSVRTKKTQINYIFQDYNQDDLIVSKLTSLDRDFNETYIMPLVVSAKPDILQIIKDELS